MNDRKIIICILSLSLLLIAVAGCVQTEDTTAEKQTNTELTIDSGDLNRQTGQTSLAIKKEDTASLVNEAVELMDKDGELAFEQFRQKDSKWFHNDTYLSIWTTEGIRVAYAPNVSSEGESVIGLKDYNGEPLDELFIGTALSEEGEGWVSYYWPKPGETSPSLKYTFVKRTSIDKQIYAVTSGFYADDHVYTNSLEDIQYFTRFKTVFLGNLLHPATSDRELGIDYSIAHVIIRPGGSIEAHMMRNPEAYYILAGEGILYIEDIPFELYEGRLVLIPENSKQQTVNTGEADLEFFAIDQPAWSQENEELLE
jgi:mannose-6-phosphate isomerase-like protein (cupin superfamily)